METPEILKRAAQKAGFKRTKYIEKNIPTSMEQIVVMSLFCDVRSMFVASSLLLHRIKEEAKGSKYFILCSWPGFESLFPYADEYWSVASPPEHFYKACDGFKNNSDLAITLPRELNYFFKDTMSYDSLKPYYDNGITQEFFDRFRNIKRFLPAIPSSAILGNEFNLELGQRPGYKIFIYPSKEVRNWFQGKQKMINAPKDFWIELIKELVAARYCPVVYCDQMAHDLSPELTKECIHIRNKDTAGIMAAMRATGCVLDVFNGISRLAIPARCPFIALDDRLRFAGHKEFEIDDLCSSRLPKEYIFSFSTIIASGDIMSWKFNIFKNIIAKLNKFMPTLNRDSWPTTSEEYKVVPYETIRKHKSKKLGTRFIRVERL